MIFAQIAVNVPSITGVFDYHLPPGLEGKVGAGHLVTVPFGKQTVQGVVLGLIPRPAVAETKTVLDLLDPAPVLTAAQLALAQELSAITLAPLAEMIGLMLPPGLAQQADTLYTLNPQSPPLRIGDASQSSNDNRQSSNPQSPIARRLLNLLLEKGSLRGRQIDRHFKNVDWRRTAAALVRQGALTSQAVLPPPSVRPKFIRTAQLAVPPETAEQAMPELGRTAETLSRRQAALRTLMREPQALDVAWVYAESGCTLADLRVLAESDLIVLRETEIWRDPLVRIDQVPLQAPVLTPDQQAAWDQVQTAFRQRAGGKPVPPFLLHGVTGSGKTEIYLRAAGEAIRAGRQAIILVPEIALTPQTVRRFLARFPGQVGLLHSRLSEGERYDTWRRARLGLLKVVIGPRSALFAPLPDVGFIAVDECHDGSYYQSEPPFYHAGSAARLYARLCGAVCVLGSATPPIVLRAEAEEGKSFHLLQLPERITSASDRSPAPRRELPSVSVIDLRTELKSSNRGIFSRELAAALGEVLDKKQQAILFLNRRGTATYVFCRECGASLRCPRCDMPLTYHSPAEALLCHHCGYLRQFPKACPRCGSSQIKAYGLGSEKVEAEVQALFPSARTARWDWETTRQKDAHEIILSHFVAGRADVLIGTQMLAKGLDLPRVTLVGIVLADVGLNLPDPFAAERTFDVLTQVAGRAGRSELGGRVVLQTFQPESYIIQAAAGHDYAAFYRQELEYRRQLGYPPFGGLVRLEVRDARPAEAEKQARQMGDRVLKWLEADDRRQTTLVGPVPCFFARLNGLYRWQMLLRGPDPASLLRDKNLGKWRVEVDPVSLL
jgi:primosomal protein N' (replication factor Y) (superfamily II helicase)